MPRTETGDMMREILSEFHKIMEYRDYPAYVVQERDHFYVRSIQCYTDMYSSYYPEYYVSRGYHGWWIFEELPF